MSQAISVNANVGGPMASIDVTQLNDLLSKGWTINQTIASEVGPILVVLDPPHTENPS